MGSGLDLFGATSVGAYHDSLEGEERERLALTEEFAPDRLVFCVANTKALWPALIDAARSDEALRSSAHPVDDYVASEMARAGLELAARHGLRVFSIPAREIGPPKLALARLGALSGVGHLAPSQLLVHETYGPWIGLRGALVVDVAGPRRAEAAASPCRGCAEKPCTSALERAVRSSGGLASITRESVARDYELWLRVRLVCPLGQAARYERAHAEYHYTKRRSLLPWSGGRDPTG